MLQIAETSTVQCSTALVPCSVPPLQENSDDSWNVSLPFASKLQHNSSSLCVSLRLQTSSRFFFLSAGCRNTQSNSALCRDVSTSNQSHCFSIPITHPRVSSPPSSWSPKLQSAYLGKKIWIINKKKLLYYSTEMLQKHINSLPISLETASLLSVGESSCRKAFHPRQINIRSTRGTNSRMIDNSQVASKVEVLGLILFNLLGTLSVLAARDGFCSFHPSDSFRMIYGPPSPQPWPIFCQLLSGVSQLLWERTRPAAERK